MAARTSPARLLAALLAAGPTGVAATASATENGNQDYPVGVNTVVPAIQPPPGTTQFYDYLAFYDAGSNVGATGKKSVPGFHVNVIANAFRLQHTWGSPGAGGISSGGWSLTSGLVVPLVHLSARVDGARGTDFTLGDIDVQPLYLNWVSPSRTFFIFGGPDLYLPTGHYDQTDVANAGLNTYTIMPTLAVTWFATPRVILSTQISASIRTTNPATHYHSGSTFNADWAADWVPSTRLKQLSIGLQGYATQQVSDDTVAGQVYDNGHIDRVLAIGPQIRWDFATGGGMALKVQHEFAVENQSKGDRVWFQVALPVFR